MRRQMLNRPTHEPRALTGSLLVRAIKNMRALSAPPSSPAKSFGLFLPEPWAARKRGPFSLCAIGSTEAWAASPSPPARFRHRLRDPRSKRRDAGGSALALALRGSGVLVFLALGRRR